MTPAQRYHQGQAGPGTWHVFLDVGAARQRVVDLLGLVELLAGAEDRGVRVVEGR